MCRFLLPVCYLRYNNRLIIRLFNAVICTPVGYIATIQATDTNDEFYILDEGEDVFEKEDFQTETLREGQYRYDAAENIFWKINDEPSDLSF